MNKNEDEDRKIKMETARIPVRNMLKKGLPLDLIAELLNVDLETVEALDKEYKEV